LLFLGSGSVIHGLHEEQDMRRMGALRAFMPITAATFIVGWLAIAGVPPFSGFWSKDEVLLFAWGSDGAGALLWGIGLITALLTAFYMSRLVFMVFFGEPRWRGETVPSPAGPDDTVTPGHVGDAGEAATVGEPGTAATVQVLDEPHPGAHGEPHEPSWLMTAPLIVLAMLAVVAGALNLPFTEDLKFLEHWLYPVIGESEAQIDVATGTKVALAVAAVVASLVGIGLGALVYLRHRIRAVEPTALARGWYYDEAITAFAGGPGHKAFDGIAWFDRTVIDGAANGVASLVRGAGRGLRRGQSGFVRSYALGLAAGVVIVLGYFLTRLSF
jgi:NADH-quinone oxidoreductase subunit L